MLTNSGKDSDFCIRNSSQFELKNKVPTDSNHIIFTDASIQYLKPQSKRVVFWCKGLQGFGIRINPSGTKSWIVKYRIDDRQRFMTLGRYPKMSLHKARKAAAEAMDKIQHGIDAAEEKVLANKRDRETETVKELLPIYIDYLRKKQKRTWYEDERCLTKDMLPEIGWKKVHQVTHRDIGQIITGLFLDREAPVQAKRMLSYMRGFFKFAKNKGLIEINPCSDIDAPAQPRSRKRALTPKEIYLFWNNLEKAGMALSIKQGLRFMLNTMARGNEVRHMEWTDVDWTENIWIIPEHKTKNRKEHRIPLNQHAMSIINSMKPFTGESKFVFGWKQLLTRRPHIDKSDCVPLGKDAFSHSLRDNFHHIGVEKRFRPHDLRKTGATLLTTLGYPRDWVSRLLNHSSYDVTDSYDLYLYDDEKKIGVDIINYILDRILGSEKIEDVPSLKTLKREVAQQGLLFSTAQPSSGNNFAGYPAKPSSPVSYRLSYDLGSLKK